MTYLLKCNYILDPSDSGSSEEIVVMTQPSTSKNVKRRNIRKRYILEDSDDEGEEEPKNEVEKQPKSKVEDRNKSNTKRKLVKKNKSITYSWTKDDLSNPAPDEFHAETNEELTSPLEYFSKFFSLDIIEDIVYQTNLYSTQVRGQSIATTNSEMTDFLAILLMMGIIHLPSYEDYWSANTRISQIANLMPIKRFKLLRRYIHFNNNDLLTDDTKDRFFKIRPLIENIRKNCQKFHLENTYAVDETMVAYKGTRGGNLRQYIKNKPHKWGYKFFVLAGVSGIIRDFIPYQGELTFIQLEGTKNELSEEEKSLGVGASAVISLCKSLPDPANSVIYFDNYFSSLQLFIYLKDNMNILSLGTLRSDRIAGCPIETDKILSKQGRGSFDYKADMNKGVIIIKWVDNKCVLLGSTLFGINPTCTVKRYSKVAKAKVDVVCPNLVKQYNKHMGGVDKANALMGLYRSPSKAKRWYFAIFTYLLDINVVNAWLVYRQDCKTLKVKHKPLKWFRLEIIQALSLAGKTVKRGRPSFQPLPLEKKIKIPVVARPDDLTRKDNFAHWPMHTTKGRCRNCTTGTSRLKCQKCDVRLCLTKSKNCFVDFHS